MLVRDALQIAGTLSEPSKMPGYGYGLPTWACVTGSKLREKKGSVCHSCYACKGRYVYRPCLDAQNKRLRSITDEKWVDAMVTMIKSVSESQRRKNDTNRYFRWHDSGDIQSVAHLDKIVQIAYQLPRVMFWLPTKEKQMVVEWLKTHEGFPPNLCVRVSATMIDGGIPKLAGKIAREAQTCSVHNFATHVGHECDAYLRDGTCGDCRKCWDKSVPNVSYHRH